ncbi:MAG: hypothetical protein JRG96_05145 [Deltaproteobacteria bacterium]|nr:hypothetical protein [Deltaproteobacteria bacterium]MBW2418497.1 hypothetical protein [Deltaproteobacteria bacterium]
MPHPSRLAGCCTTLLLLALCSEALADPEPPAPEESAADSEAPTPEEARADELPSETPGLAGRVFRIVRKPLPDFSISQTAIVGSDFDDLSLDSARTTLTAGVAFPLTKRSVLRLRGSGQFALYNFSRDGALGPVPPTQLDLGDFFTNRWELIGRYKFSDRWAGVAGLRLGSNVESGASYADGLRFAGLAGFGFRNRANFTLVLGVVLGTRIDRSSIRVGPLVDFKWQFAERYKIESSGLGLRFTGTVNDRLDLFVSGRMSGIRYLLADRSGDGACPPPEDGPCIPDLGSKGTMRDRWAPILVGADWEFAKHWVLRAHIGAVAYRKISFHDEDGEELSSHTADGSALVLGLRVRFRI